MAKRHNDDKSITSAPRYLEYLLAMKRDISLPEIPDLCIISYTADLIRLARRTYPHYSVDLGCTNPTMLHFFFPKDGTPFAIARGQHGSPMAAVLIEELIALGFERFLVIGAAGHPAKTIPAQLQVGELVVAEKALIYEGTSGHYDRNATESHPDRDLLRDLCAALTSLDISFDRGAIATTDALYRETRGFISSLVQQDVLAVDMEMSALFTVAGYHGKAIGGLLFISDLIETAGEWKLGLLQGRYEELQDRLFDVIIKISGNDEI